jgi:glutamate--cysteine ligase catalytic subunit
MYFFPYVCTVSLVWISSVECAILRKGNPISWLKSKPFLKHVRFSGIEQFLYHYNRTKYVLTPEFFWGDEIEYGVFKYDSNFKMYDLATTRGDSIREYLQQLESSYPPDMLGCEWQPEYGSWMVETVPNKPYSGNLLDLCKVERSLNLRRKRLHAALLPDEIAPSISNFPMLGVLSYPHAQDCRGDIANSEYASDKLINPHPRFGTLTKNIRSRRKRNVNILVPKEIKLIPNEGSIGDGSMNPRAMKCHCNSVNQLDIKDSENSDMLSKDFIHMDAMSFGKSNCPL